MQCRRLISGFLGLAGLAVAASTSAQAVGNRWTQPFVPTEVYAGFADGAAFVNGATFEAGQEPACRHKGLLKLSVDSEKAFSLVLAAFLAGHRLQCMVTDGCDGDYPVANQCRIIRR